MKSRQKLADDLRKIYYGLYGPSIMDDCDAWQHFVDGFIDEHTFRLYLQNYTKERLTF